VTDGWIVIPNWHRFQHYGMARRPPWIKNYTALLRDNDYLDLTLAERGLLHGIWLAYADHRGQLRSFPQLRSTLGLRGRLDHNLGQMASLNHAGLIDVVASTPLDLVLKDKESRARAREATTEGTIDRKRRAAASWIRNGAALEVPTDRLAAVLADEFKITEPDLLADLLAQAAERRVT
jgi:hypothetical protein